VREPVNDERADIVTHRLGIPDRLAEQPLHPQRAAMPGLLEAGNSGSSNARCPSVKSESAATGIVSTTSAV